MFLVDDQNRDREHLRIDRNIQRTVGFVYIAFWAGVVTLGFGLAGKLQFVMELAAVILITAGSVLSATATPLWAIAILAWTIWRSVRRSMQAKQRARDPLLKARLSSEERNALIEFCEQRAQSAPCEEEAEEWRGLIDRLDKTLLA
jgi:hypothetical protein